MERPTTRRYEGLTMPERLPIQPVEKPIICGPYEEPNDHWVYDSKTGEASRAGHRRPAGYWYKTERVGAAQARLFTEEERDDLLSARMQKRRNLNRGRPAVILLNALFSEATCGPAATILRADTACGDDISSKKPPAAMMATHSHRHLFRFLRF